MWRLFLLLDKYFQTLCPISLWQSPHILSDQWCVVQDSRLCPPYRQPRGDGDKAASKDRLLPASAIPAVREMVQMAALPLVWSKLTLPFLMFLGSESCAGWLTTKQNSQKCHHPVQHTKAELNPFLAKREGLAPSMKGEWTHPSLGHP